MKILFTGGGSGGHILPIVAVTREIRKIHLGSPDGKKLEFFYVGPKDEFQEILLAQEGIGVKKILAGKIRRYLNWKSVLQNIGDVLFKIPLGVLQSFFYLFLLMPDLIFAKGGFGSFPTVVSGWILRIPVLLHESDIAPGLANKILSKFSTKIFTSFPKTEYFSPKKMAIAGNPIRKEILTGTKEEGRALFRITREKPVILILGGSQGAQRINDKILEILPDLLKEFEVIHQCGEKNFQEVRDEAKAILVPEQENSFHLFPFMKEEELKQALAVADLAVSRAGSGSIFEIAAAGLPSVLIPLPESAQNHQVKNAYAYGNTGASIVLEEANFTPHFFLEKLKYLFSQPADLKRMSEAAKSFAKPEAAKQIAEYVVNALK
ncbi:MAG: UDP-N-acetylglucosamine--N-acetylmuramyl-(pentapeptide) pyrophosphoryl-undecaprenol N-acetylglucosamine transferase [Candidatus Nealsonbacteria bacterium]|nr:UDP-N-acetylglucosamine--N-acetylmuramyl-(pentapeptide) pyrophosphoryl-undecaprenol N-acetylglucosamine transferase [Candidatus Nealsonbacteria bacterium]